MVQDLTQKNPLCAMGLMANSILFFCIDNSDTDILAAYNMWSNERGKRFKLAGDETAFALSLFENFLILTTPEQREILKNIEMKNMTPDEIMSCLGK